jgi:uncharacterized FlgJ-related protein
MRTLIFALLFVSLKCYAPPLEDKTNVKEVNKLYQLKSFDTKAFSKENFIAYVTLMDSVNAKPIIQQALLETGWFKSGSFKHYNNIFGMKYANKRANKISGKGLGHAAFHSWTDSVQDYFLWRSHMVKKYNLQITDYYTFLTKVHYAQDVNYISKLKSIKYV